MKPSNLSAFRFSRRTSRFKPSAIREILKATESPQMISFAGGLPAPELFPVEDLRRAAGEVLAEDGPGAMQYSVTEGYPRLREWVSEHLLATVGVRAAPDHVIVTNGSQQGLDLVAKVLLDPGDRVLTETPGYLGALQAFAAYEADIAGVATDREGMDVDALRRALADTSGNMKLLYLIPNFQNPTGRTLSEARRREIVALSAEFGVPIVEDDPYGRLRYSGRPAPALCSYPEARNWIYLGSSSKILSPGMRVGWIVCPDQAFREALVSAKQAADLHTSSFTQRVVWRYLRRPGALEAHLGRLCAAYGRRRDAMLGALARHLPGCRWNCPEGGLFIWVEAPAEVDTLELLRAAMERDVAFVPGEPFWVGAGPRNTLRLNFSNASEERIEAGILRLAEALAAGISAAG